MRLTSSEEIGTELKEKDVFVFELANDDVSLVYRERKERTRYRSGVVTPRWTTQRTNPGYASPTLNPRWGYSIKRMGSHMHL